VGSVRLREIGEIVEVGNAMRANEYLTLGWVLIATVAHGDTRHGKTLWYSLGWPRSQGKAPHPTPAALHLSVVEASDEALYSAEDERIL
jgi:hypothetical protein